MHKRNILQSCNPTTHFPRQLSNCLHVILSSVSSQYIFITTSLQPDVYRLVYTECISGKLFPNNIWESRIITWRGCLRIPLLPVDWNATDRILTLMTFNSKEPGYHWAPGRLSRLSVRLLISAQVLISGSWVQSLHWAPQWAWSYLKQNKTKQNKTKQNKTKPPTELYVHFKRVNLMVYELYLE